MAMIIDGKRISGEIKDELKAEVSELKTRKRSNLGSDSSWNRSCIYCICR